VQRQLNTYILTCGYIVPDFTEWELKIKTVPGYTACPDPPAASQCVVGTYLTKSGGCNSCYGDGDTIGPNCDDKTTIACTAYSCYCMPKYASDPCVPPLPACLPARPPACRPACLPVPCRRPPARPRACPCRCRCCPQSHLLYLKGQRKFTCALLASRNCHPACLQGPQQVHPARAQRTHGEPLAVCRRRLAPCLAGH
jgi:hypothetical protein